MTNNNTHRCHHSKVTDCCNAQADGSYVIPHPITLNNKTGLYTARSELFMTLGSMHFNQTGQISVRCEASIVGNNQNTDKTIHSK